MRKYFCDLCGNETSETDLGQVNSDFAVEQIAEACSKCRDILNNTFETKMREAKKAAIELVQSAVRELMG